jgi:hypothetical protein
MTILTVGACSDKQTDPTKWSEDEINTWFEKKGVAWRLECSTRCLG